MHKCVFIYKHETKSSRSKEVDNVVSKTGT
jgi:hypothetical protein